MKNGKSSAGKIAGSSKRAKKLAALKAKAVADDKENVAPAIWKSAATTNPASELKKTQEEPRKVMMMPAGESSDEQEGNAEKTRENANDSEDSFDYIQSLAEKEKKTRSKREKAKDRKKTKISKEVEKE